MSKTKHNHLVRNVPNTEDNRAFIKKVNKMSRQSDSVWKLYIRYRKPKEGHAYGWGGSLKRDNANAFSVYIQDRRPYGEIPMNQYRSKLWEDNRKLEKENKRLKRELALRDNPFAHLSACEIRNEISDTRDEIVARFLKCNNDLELLKNDTLKTRYYQLKEALEYAEENS